MTATIKTDGSWNSAEGTLAEVLEALEDYKVPQHSVTNVFWDETNYVAVWRGGP